MKLRSIIFSILFSITPCIYSQAWDTYSDTWVATDDLGREVYSEDFNNKSDSLTKEAYSVGMFYYLWHGKHTKEGRPIFDITEILKADSNNPKWGDVGEMHWWGKPVLGYYKAGDSFVIAKHLQMLIDAGVDFLFFDVTNGLLYEDVILKIMAEIDRREFLGMKSPKLCFMSYWGGAKMIKNIYTRFYSDKKYDKYWYNYNNKPLILADINLITDSEDIFLKDHFTFRKSWAWLDGQNKNEWAWLEFYPQKPGWSETKHIPEQLSVSVAQHATSKIGKSYHNRKEPILNNMALADSTSYGLYFEEQWQTAHKIHPPVLMITQFNEWTAQRFLIKDSNSLRDTRPGAQVKVGETCFVDAYNAEFNRDIEPSTHPLIRDNYYMQFVSNMRKYKGARYIPVQGIKRKIKINTDFDQWNNIIYEYRDDKGDILHQNTYGFNNMDTITNLTGRNDFIISKVTQDNHNFYFFASTMSNITPANPEIDKPWITLLIHAGDSNINWYGYNFCVKPFDNKGLMLFKNINGTYEWEPICSVKYKVLDNKIHLSIPKEKLPSNGVIDFKWMDNIEEKANLDILDLYRYGDVAPNGRFNYRYQYKPTN